MTNLLKEPLVHFLLLGGLLFAAYGWLNQGRDDPQEILVTRGTQEHLVTVFARTWQRPPTEAEFEALLRDHVREEIAFREGMAMGLDSGDTVIRRRMRQKLELLTDEIVGLAEPTDAELSEFLQTRTEDFMIEPRLSLRHVYVSRDRRGDAAVEEAEAILAALDDGANWQDLGDPLPLGDQFEDLRLGEF
ncbi:MAG: hypothetical protein R3212_09615, partial [Xanthomonadales bacterium]|nr:hypothetical protein [Xanthomonadales bacterium]